MLRILLKLATGIVVLGASVFTAVAATGATGDAMAEAFGSGDEKGPDGAVTRQGAAYRKMRGLFSFQQGDSDMSEEEEPSRENSSFDGVPVYRVTLVRESTATQLPSIPVRKSSEAAVILRPLFAGLDREQFVVLMVDAQHIPVGISIVSIGSLTA